MMEQRQCIVQFLHPGEEHRPSTGINWNVDRHKRKFMVQQGKYLMDGAVREGEILFWGEWEAESELVKKFTNSPVANGPKFLYRPYYNSRFSYAGLQNTDPFVFGDQMHYTICQQHRKVHMSNHDRIINLTRKRPTQLRYLQEGSIVLFGSCINGEFALDSVLVVRSHIDYDQTNYKQELVGTVSDTYLNVTIAPLYDQSSKSSTSCVQTFDTPSDSTICSPTQSTELTNRLYFGATYENDVAGMYSFFPCLPNEDSSFGFARPIIKIKEIISDNKMQGYTRTFLSGTFEEAKRVWDEVVRQVTEEYGLALGIFASLPTKQD